MGPPAPPPLLLLPRPFLLRVLPPAPAPAPSPYPLLADTPRSVILSTSTTVYSDGQLHTAIVGQQTARSVQRITCTVSTAGTVTTATARAVVATAAVATAVADAAAGGQCPPPRSCSRVCSCSRSCPLLQLLRQPIPPRLQGPRKIQAPEEARSRIGMAGSVQCRSNVKQERYTQAVRHSTQESECPIFSSG